jgi:hypothetical protein
MFAQVSSWALDVPPLRVLPSNDEETRIRHGGPSSGRGMDDITLGLWLRVFYGAPGDQDAPAWTG